jgi:hypothetical protein
VDFTEDHFRLVGTTFEDGEDVAILIDHLHGQARLYVSDEESRKLAQLHYYELFIRPEEESFITQIERFLANTSSESWFGCSGFIRRRNLFLKILEEEGSNYSPISWNETGKQKYFPLRYLLTAGNSKIASLLKGAPNEAAETFAKTYSPGIQSCHSSRHADHHTEDKFPVPAERRTLQHRDQRRPLRISRGRRLQHLLRHWRVHVERWLSASALKHALVFTPRVFTPAFKPKI